MKIMIRSDVEGVTGVTTYAEAEKSGTAGAVLPHSYSRKNLDIRLNGRSFGEIGVEAAVAGDFGVPFWFITGDSAGMAEAESDIPGVRTVSVKKSFGENEAQCYSAAKTAEMIRSNGTLIRGENDLSGEVGHMCLVPGGRSCFCGKRGCWQAYCGGLQMARRTQEMLSRQEIRISILVRLAAHLWPIHPHSHEDIVEAVLSGDRDAAEAAARAHVVPTYKERLQDLRAKYGDDPIL